MTPPMYGTVEQIERLGASMIRVVFGGPGLDSFAATDRTDQYVNALFVPEAATYSAPFEPAEVSSLDADLRPRGRRYTVRRWDETSRLLTIDFVAHGDAGYAGRWARRARRGDTLQMVGPSGGYRPDPESDWYLMTGDESALPAIAASLEVVPAGSHCAVRVVVDGPDSEIELPGPGTLDVKWLHRRTAAEPDTLLADAVASLSWRPGTVDVFVHGEASEVRAVRRYLLEHRGVDRERASISPYWRRDHTDEAWRATKREWLAAQDADTPVSDRAPAG
ncbi:MAG: siderophore-interacting protein [Ilumatobacter sp.]|uniref:siderophore-interacting protein n=1 Tax=Ilumatobacter sp. TaxID=1967498 RepID=UPI003297B8C1